MSLAADARAVRTSVTLAEGDHLAAVRVTGAASHELLDRVSPRQLFVRSGQMLHTLLLDDAAMPVADVYLCCDDDGYLILAEGMSGPGLVSYLERFRTGIDSAVSVVDLGDSHGVLCLDGPYAWELLAQVTSPEVIGLPYLGFFHEGRFTCFRAGKTGEYGYHLMAERARLPELRELFLAAGIGLELRRVGLDALDVCQLEAGFFNVRREARAGLTPVELQLQWRVSAGRQYPGAATVSARRRGATARVTLVACASALAVDTAVELDGERIGSILHAGHSAIRDEWLGVALLDRALAHPGIDGFSCAGAAVRTVSGPAINNRSLYVDPQRHSWATRDDAAFPPLVRPHWS